MAKTEPRTLSGFMELLPNEQILFNKMLKTIEETYQKFGFLPLDTPIIELSEVLLAKAGGETEKQIYRFNRGDTDLSLRFDLTVPLAKYVAKNYGNLSFPFRRYQIGKVYRGERPQKGRLREFHQIGIELIGSSSYLADVECILVGNQIFKALDIPDIKLTINSIGCPKCRGEYQKILREFIGKNLDSYCSTCKGRFDKNPLRILDCKEKKCKELNQGAPKMIDYLCEECSKHFENVKTMLTSLGIDYEIDSSIVRGLDYYTKTVFEFIDKESGLTVLGGGRYDGLVEELGGPQTPAVGFATGVERIMEMYNTNNKDLKDNVPDLYILSSGIEENKFALEISEKLRKENYIIEKDISERSFKSQMKYANKIEAKYLLVIGEDELASKKAKIKNMATGEEIEVDLDIGKIKEVLLNK